MIIPVLIYCNVLSIFDNRLTADHLKSIDSCATRIVNKHADKAHTVTLPFISSIKKKHACVLVCKCVDGKFCENFAEFFSWLSHEKSTRDNWISLNFTSVRTEFLKKSVHFSGDNPYNELPVQIHQLESFEKFRNSINTFFDWDRRYWIIAFLILCSNDFKILRRREVLLNFSMDILHKSFFRWFGSVSLCSLFSAHLYSYRLIFVWFLLLLRLFLNQKTMVRHTSVGIFLL